MAKNKKVTPDSKATVEYKQQPGALQPAGNREGRKQTLQEVKAEHRGRGSDDMVDKMLEVLLGDFR